MIFTYIKVAPSLLVGNSVSLGPETISITVDTFRMIKDTELRDTPNL